MARAVLPPPTPHEAWILAGSPMEGQGHDPMSRCPPVEDDEDIPGDGASWCGDEASSLADTDIEEGSEEEDSEISSLASDQGQQEPPAGPDLPVAGEPCSLRPGS